MCEEPFHKWVASAFPSKFVDLAAPDPEKRRKIAGLRD
jgi:hypothetical protein